MHLIWMAIVVPGMFLIPWSSVSSRAPLIWKITGAVSLLGILSWIGIDLTQYLATDTARPSESFQRAAFAVITLTNVPLIAIGVGSVVNWCCCKWLWDGSTERPLNGDVSWDHVFDDVENKESPAAVDSKADFVSA